jgi:hypothetical protein
VDLACARPMTPDLETWRTRTNRHLVELDDGRFSKVGVCRAGVQKAKSNRGRIIIHPRRAIRGEDSEIRKPYCATRLRNQSCGKDPGGWRVCGTCQNRLIGEHLSFIGWKEGIFQIGQTQHLNGWLGAQVLKPSRSLGKRPSPFNMPCRSGNDVPDSEPKAGHMGGGGVLSTQHQHISG